MMIMTKWLGVDFDCFFWGGFLMILVIFGVLLVVVLALVIVKVSSVIVGERQLLMSLCKFLVGGRLILL